MASSKEFIALGTSSQVPTRHRSHSSYVLRWDDQLILFDPGEGTQRQCTIAGVSVAKLTAVVITHFHGDHCLGLPGVIQRRALDNRNNATEGTPLPVFFPADGKKYFEAMRSSSIFNDSSNVQPRPIEGGGFIAKLGNHDLSAEELDHRVTTFGYRVDAPDHCNVDAEKLASKSIVGSDIARLKNEGYLETSSGRVELGEVSSRRPGSSMAFVMDTRPCSGASKLAQDVDLLVCESTFVETERELADEYFHMTALQAAELAKEASAKRLALTHFSSRYNDLTIFADEAANRHDDVRVLRDLDVVEVPHTSR